MFSDNLMTQIFNFQRLFNPKDGGASSLFHLSLFLSIIFALQSCISENEDSEYAINNGSQLPGFSVILNDGTEFNSHSLVNQQAMIVFFNTSCKDCRVELPVINRFHTEHPEIEVICIARNEERESIESFWNENELDLKYAAAGSYPYSLFASSIIPRIYITYSPDSGTIPRIAAQFSDSPLPTLEELTSQFSGK